MEARARLAAGLLAVAVSLGASYRTSNFVVTAPSQELAEEIGQAAEKYRHDLAIEWLGKAMPNWSRPCPIYVHLAKGNGGETSFIFDQGEVFDWKMTIQGTRERLLDSVLPHEVTHTVFASHFRQALPRWADEGACTTVEHESERARQQVMLVEFLKTRRGIAFPRMFAMKQYPRDIMPLYAEGHSLATFLINQGGRRQFVNFVADGLRSERWGATVNKYYGYKDLAQLQSTWLDWVRQGSPLAEASDETNLAVAVDEGPASDTPNEDLVTQASYQDLASGRGPAPSRDGPVSREDEEEEQMVPVQRPEGYVRRRGGGSAVAARESQRNPSSPRELGGWRAAASAQADPPSRLAENDASDRGAADLNSSALEEPSATRTRTRVTRPQPAEKLRQMILAWDQRSEQRDSAEAASARTRGETREAPSDAAARRGGRSIYVRHAGSADRLRR